MRNGNTLATALIAFVAGACGDAYEPLGVEPVTAPAFSEVAACYTVAGTITEYFQGADIPNGVFYFGGPVSGDLVGTSLSGLSASDNPAGDPPSPLTFGAGTSWIAVSGGSIPVLQGATLTFELEQTVIQRGTAAQVANQRMTLVSGARRGHLVTSGAFDYTTLSSTSEYHGSICP